MEGSESANTLAAPAIAAAFFDATGKPARRSLLSVRTRSSLLLRTYGPSGPAHALRAPSLITSKC